MNPYHRSDTGPMQLVPFDSEAAERELLALTAKLWNGFCDLPDRHPSDAAEMQRDIHSIQNRIMARAAVRQNPAMFGVARSPPLFVIALNRRLAEEWARDHELKSSQWRYIGTPSGLRGLKGTVQLVGNWTRRHDFAEFDRELKGYRGVVRQ